MNRWDKDLVVQGQTTLIQLTIATIEDKGTMNVPQTIINDQTRSGEIVEVATMAGMLIIVEVQATITVEVQATITVEETTRRRDVEVMEISQDVLMVTGIVMAVNFKIDETTLNKEVAEPATVTIRTEEVPTLKRGEVIEGIGIAGTISRGGITETFMGDLIVLETTMI